MKRYETKTETVQREKVTLHEIRCDICGKFAKDPRHYPAPNWIDERFEFQTVQVCKVVGNSYPEGSLETRTIFDLCPTCFDTVLVPFLNSKGAQQREEKSE